MRRLSGTAMEALVAGGRLEATDIILTHARRSFWGWLVRLGTRNYWNHVSMVYCPGANSGGLWGGQPVGAGLAPARWGGQPQGIAPTAVVASGAEFRNAAASGGRLPVIEARGYVVGIHDIAEYFENPKRYDAAVKRLEKGWFRGGAGSASDYRREICAFASSKIDDTYKPGSFRTVARKIFRPMRLGYRFLLRGRRLRKAGGLSPRLSKPLKGSGFTCSGFVQWCYHQGVASLVSGEGPGNHRLQDVIFNPRLSGEVTDYGLHSTTPADLARSDKLSWKYLVKKGVVWEDSSEEEADRILGAK